MIKQRISSTMTFQTPLPLMVLLFLIKRFSSKTMNDETNFVCAAYKNTLSYQKKTNKTNNKKKTLRKRTLRTCVQSPITIWITKKPSPLLSL